MSPRTGSSTGINARPGQNVTTDIAAECADETSRPVLALYFSVCRIERLSTRSLSYVIRRRILCPRKPEALPEELKDLLRIPSVSTAEEHKPDIRKAADIRRQRTEAHRLRACRDHPHRGPPAGLRRLAARRRQAHRALLCALRRAARRAAGRMDHARRSSPPSATSNIYARGAVDDKGQLWMQVKAFESLFKASGGKLPINVRVLIEGEEEVGGEARYAKFVARAQRPAEGRLRAGLRHRTVRARPAYALRRPARPGVHRGGSGGRQNRPALRRVRRRRAQSSLRLWSR